MLAMPPSNIPCRRRAGLAAPLVVFLLAGCVRLPVETKPTPPPPPLPQPPPVAKPLPPHPVIPPAPPAVPPAKPEMSFAVLFAVQTRLDGDNCSPGGIDGRWGSKSKKALAAWQRMNGRSATGHLDESVLTALGDANGVHSTYFVSAQDHAALTPYPSSWLARSAQARMGYASIEELVAERHHLYRATLRQLNPAAAWPNPPPGTILVVPVLASKPLPTLSRIEIRLEQKTLRAYGTNGQLVAHFPCSIAADKAKRPAGETLRVALWAVEPDYTFDPALFAEDPQAAAIGRKLRIPPGPNNPVGLAWIGLDRPGYGIHGSPAPEDISKTESHGCFRLTNWDALKLVRAVRKNLPFVVLP